MNGPVPSARSASVGFAPGWLPVLGHAESVVDGQCGNRHAHIMTILATRMSQWPPIVKGSVDLSRWQQLMPAVFCDLRPDPCNPERRVDVHPWNAPSPGAP
ncbi:hypothetical protein C9F11_44760 (plasmid) [Streptomyces sp. YIM 121038]|uniref:hypothetical protein n=1 Tax=Streptomyces sp. YIM 121038 TaxID=2136401 RepID=UPI00111017D4|nr:hypothetical protein [Streptomyces sp. YIM 121038]QCX82514.1 hypothetical protein C9F11_44760 [Streptomyces sp. YIM 121038]